MSVIKQDIKKAKEIMQSFVELLDRAEQQNPAFIDLLKTLEAERTDILHEIELTDSGEADEEQITKLREVQKKRRAIKDMIGIWMPIKEFAKQNGRLKKSIELVCSQVDRVIENHNTRIYTPRTDSKFGAERLHVDCTDIDLTEELEKIRSIRKQKGAA